MIYEYQCKCKECKHILARLTFSMKEEEKVVCPMCGSDMRKVISAGSWRFKK